MSKKADMMRNLMDYIELNDIVEYCTLLDSLRDGGSETAKLFGFACDEVALVVTYLDSVRRCRGLEPEIDVEDLLFCEEGE